MFDCLQTLYVWPNGSYQNVNIPGYKSDCKYANWTTFYSRPVFPHLFNFFDRSCPCYCPLVYSSVSILSTSVCKSGPIYLWTKSGIFLNINCAMHQFCPLISLQHWQRCPAEHVTQGYLHSDKGTDRQKKAGLTCHPTLICVSLPAVNICAHVHERRAWDMFLSHSSEAFLRVQMCFSATQDRECVWPGHDTS